MTLNRSTDRRALTAAELTAVEPSHYPNLCELKRDEVVSLRARVREMRNKARDRLSEQRREMRGKAAPRGVEATGDDKGSALKLRILSAALKRLNKEADRLERGTGRRSQAALSRKALEIKRANEAEAHHPDAGRTADEGMNALPNRKEAPSGALNAEGQKPVLERSRKAR